MMIKVRCCVRSHISSQNDVININKGTVWHNSCAHERFLILETWLILTNKATKKSSGFIPSLEHNNHTFNTNRQDCFSPSLRMNIIWDAITLTTCSHMLYALMWAVHFVLLAEENIPYILTFVHAWMEVLPGIGRWGLLVVAGSPSVSDIPSQTSSAFWLEPENTTTIVDIIVLQ